MNLIEKWKNRKTKKKLLEENIRLKAEIDLLYKIPKPPVCTIERNIQGISASYVLPIRDRDVPMKVIKRLLFQELSENIEPFVEFDFRDDENCTGIYTATLYVATGDRRYGK